MKTKRLIIRLGAPILLLLVMAGTLFIVQSGAHAASWPIYKSGSSGESVASIQYMLRARGYSLQADGQFGAITAQKVKDFQKRNGLGVDGIVGPLTWEKLIVTTRQGSSGDAVIALQRQLNARGAGLGVDGQFGGMTAQAVRNFQSANGLGVDGIAGPQTWSSLVGGSGNGGGGGNGGGSGSDRLSQSEAETMLRNAGIGVSSSGNCSNRNNSRCTSLEQIRRATITGIIAFKQSSGCPVTITGGTETGHAGGTYTHGNGYKVDVVHSACVTNYIHSRFSYKGLRGDGAPMYDDARGNRYADEGNHWDILYY